MASVFAALCYSEFASLVPMAGSAYTYGYATLGELFAWIIGWDLILEYAVGAITVAIGWSGYVVSFLHDFGINIPPALSAARGTHLIDIPAALAPLVSAKVGWVVSSASLLDQIKAAGTDPTALSHVTTILNLPAVFIIFVVTTLLVVGIKESANFNNLIVLVKVAVVLLFIFGAAHAIATRGWAMLEARADELTGIGIVDRVLHQRLADTLRRAAVHLAGEQQRIERHAKVVDHDVIGEPAAASLGVDLDLGQMRTVGIGRGLRHKGVLDRKFFGCARAAGELGERDRAIGAGDAHKTVGEFEIARTRLKRIACQLLEIARELRGRTRD